MGWITAWSSLLMIFETEEINENLLKVAQREMASQNMADLPGAISLYVSQCCFLPVLKENVDKICGNM